MSGHVFLKERWYGFDDGMYAGARLLELLSREEDIDATLHGLPDSVSTPELQIKLNEGENYALIEQLQQTARFDNPREIITVDGLRVEYADGFGLARASNTTPVVVLRFEADTQAALKRIQEDFRRVLMSANRTQRCRSRPAWQHSTIYFDRISCVQRNNAMFRPEA